MTDRDDIELGAWARRAFLDEPEAGDTIGDDLARAHTGLARRRRWTAGASGLAVVAVAFVIALAPSLMPSASDGPAPSDSPSQHRKSDPPKQRQQASFGDGWEYYAQRRQLYEVARDQLDPDGGNLRMASGVQRWSRERNLSLVGTRLPWRIPGEDGLGMVQVGIARPDIGDAEFLFNAVLCGDAYSCEEREPSDGGTAWVGRTHDGRLGVGYRQGDGELVWVLVDPLFGNMTTTPVSSVDITVDQALAFVADDRLEFLGGPACTEAQKECQRIRQAEREAAHPRG